MLYFYSTRESNPNIKKTIEKTIKSKNVKVYEFVNQGTHSLTEAYNIALDMADNEEIVVLAHDDISLEYGWDEKIKNIFDESDYGIIGVAGTATLDKNCVWWEKKGDLCGIVSHEKIVNGKVIKYDTKFSEKHEFVMEVAVVDGVFIAIKKDRIKQKFNENITGFHFYDISFCVDNFLDGVRLGVTTSFKIHHKSVGNLTPQWHKNRTLFAQLYQSKLPVEITPKISDIVKDKSVSLIPTKVAVVILTKDKIDYLIDCINSLYEKTSDKIQLNIFIGDTGSNEESLNILNDYVSSLPNKFIKVIHLPFYNFAKNNNEIINTCVTDEELILFCNNDIKLVNNALDIMIRYYQKNKKAVGTLGCRLLYNNNRIQHGGIVFYARDNHFISATHLGLKTFYWGKTTVAYDILGCTGAFLLITKENFKKVNGFNENTIECFEDVILNLDTIVKLNKKNFYVGEAACYHYESLTRNENPEQTNRINKDFAEVLLPTIRQYHRQIKKYITNI